VKVRVRIDKRSHAAITSFDEFKTGIASQPYVYWDGQLIKSSFAKIIPLLIVD
jgi:hypothetical protein